MLVKRKGRHDDVADAGLPDRVNNFIHLSRDRVRERRLCRKMYAATLTFPMCSCAAADEGRPQVEGSFD